MSRGRPLDPGRGRASAARRRLFHRPEVGGSFSGRAINDQPRAGFPVEVDSAFLPEFVASACAAEEPVARMIGVSGGS